MATKNLHLKDLRIDGGTQPRVAVSDAVISDYAEAMTAGDKLPAVLAFFDGVDYWLADGFHRFHAHHKIGARKIEVEVREGTQRDAVLYSVGANAAHGLRRSNDDKRKAVQTLLNDAEWAAWPDRKIAEVCGVSHTFVGSLRSPEAAEKRAAVRAESAQKVAPGASQKARDVEPGSSCEANFLEPGSTDSAPMVEPGSNKSAKVVAIEDPLRARIAELEDELEMMREASSEAIRIAEVAGVLMDSDAAQEMLKLNAHLEAVTRTRDALMNENAQLKAEIKRLRRAA